MQAGLTGPTGYIILGPAGLTIGRMQSNQYVVYDPRVSARHAVISYLEQGYFTITDIGSTNGTFVNGSLLAHNMPQILHSDDVICIGDTVLTFQISDQFQFSHDNPLNKNNSTREGSATHRSVHVRYRPDGSYAPEELQEKRIPFAPNYVENNTMRRSATVTPSQKLDNIPASINENKSNQKDVSPSTRSHGKIVLSVLLISFVLLSIIAFNAFEYLNRSTPDKTLDNFCKALHSKDYQSMYDQLSNKVQALGSEKLIGEDMSNVKNCTYIITKESESTASAKLSFTGLSGQLVSGTIILIKDSNNMWKIDALQNI